MLLPRTPYVSGNAEAWYVSLQNPFCQGFLRLEGHATEQQKSRQMAVWNILIVDDGIARDDLNSSACAYKSRLLQ
jgi:hypothetical protein